MIEDPTDMCLDYLVVVVQFLLQAYSNTSNSVEFFFLKIYIKNMTKNILKY